MRYHLAQFNVATLAAPLDSPQLESFLAQVDEVHEKGNESPGFVWRLQTPEGDALRIRPSDNDSSVLVNLTVWESVEAIRAFMRGAHRSVFMQRREWFVKGSGANVCWWVPEGYRPTIYEGEDRLALLRIHGPTPEAFTLSQPYPAPA